MDIRKTAQTFFLVVSIEAIISILLTLQVPSAADNQVMFGLSLQRLGILFFFIFVLLFSLAAFSNPGSQRVLAVMRLLYQKPALLNLFQLSLTTLASICLYLLFLPVQSLPEWVQWRERLLPILLFTLLFSSQLLALLFLHSGVKPKQVLRKIKNRWDNLRAPVLVFLAIFISLWVISTATGSGINPTNFWDKHGVPVLFTQVILVILVLLWIRYGTRAILSKLSIVPHHRARDVVIFISIWALAAVVWNMEPLPHNAFNPGPYPPNFQYYPYSDAQYYYDYAQLARIGQPMRLVDKPLLGSFLFFLRLVSDNEFNRILLLQTIIYAILPALVYLISRKLLNRTTGIFAALIVTLHVRNTIAASLFYWKVSHPRMTMSEFLTGLLAALLVLFLVNALTDPANKYRWLLLTGGIMGLLTLVRHNVWIFLPIILLILFIDGIRQGTNKWLRSIPVFLFAMAVTITPWAWRSEQVLGTPWYFLIPFQGTVVEQRYQLDTEEFTEPGALAPSQPTALNTSQKLASPVAVSERPQRSLANVVYEISNHFAHNVLSTLFILPSVVNANSLEGTIINHPSPSIYGYVWDGELAPGTRVMLFVNLFVLSVGLAAAWKYKRWTGLLPLVFFLAYNLGAAFALTSGGRYIVPTQWALLIYYSAGIVSFLGIAGIRKGNAANSHPIHMPTNKQQGHKKTGVLLLMWPVLFFAIGATPVVFENLFPLAYPETENLQLLQELEADNAFENAPYTHEDVYQFLMSEEDARIYTGTALYPRFFDYEDDRSLNLFPQVPKDEPALTFKLIGPTNSFINLTALESPVYFPNESEVIVVGCFSELPSPGALPFYYLEAYGVWILEDDHLIYYQAANKKGLSCDP